MNCKICGNEENNNTFTASEKMFGMRGAFDYLECGYCKCLQIIEIPDDIEKYYPEDYYSFNHKPSGGIKKFLKSQWIRKSLSETGSIMESTGKNHFTGSQLIKLKGIWPYAYLFGNYDLNPWDKVLDIGCGSGLLLRDLNSAGLKDLTGIDKYIEKDIYVNDELRILQKDITELESKYDFIMMNHSFEHMEEPEDVLKVISKYLKHDGTLMIRIPLADTYSWKEYGTDWVQLDAPRHFFLHTKKSMSILARRTGFSITNVHFDSDEFQFWGSELYRRGKNLSEMKQGQHPAKAFPGIFTRKAIEEYAEKARELNVRKQGDQAAFYLKKKK